MTAAFGKENFHIAENNTCIHEHAVHNGGMTTELEKRMKLQGWTDDTLAEKVGRHRSSISRLRRGVSCKISFDHAMAVSEITGVPVLALLSPSKPSEKAKQ